MDQTSVLYHDAPLRPVNQRLHSTDLQQLHISCITTKAVLWDSDQVLHKLGCAATVDGKRLEILDLGRGIV